MSIRGWLWHQAGGKCHWCNCDTHDDGIPGPAQATIDHVIPRCAGGTDDVENLVLACSHCNRRRNDEHHKGLPEGALLGHYRTVYGKKTKVDNASGTVAVKKGHVTPLENLRNQRDQGLAELIKLRAEMITVKDDLKSARSACRRLREETRALTVRQFTAILLRRWIRKLRSNSSS